MPINLTRRQALLSAAGAALTFSMPAWASGYPERNINLIVMWKAGGGADTATRIFTRHAESFIDKKFIVQNITGGGGAIGYTAAKSEKPDGYNLVTIQGDLPKFTPKGLAPIAIDDFDIIAGFAFQSPIIVVRADSPWKTLDEFNAAMKKDPGKYTIATTDIGGIYHQPAALWGAAAGFTPKVVTFPGSPQQVAGVLGGHADCALTWVKPNIPYVKKGELRFLGYMGSQRLEDFPDVPTLTELGYPVVWEHPYGIGGPKGMPEEAKKALEAVTKKVWDVPEFKAELENLGLSILRKGGEDYRKHMFALQDNMVKALKLIEG